MLLAQPRIVMTLDRIQITRDHCCAFLSIDTTSSSKRALLIATTWAHPFQHQLSKCLARKTTSVRNISQG